MSKPRYWWYYTVKQIATRSLRGQITAESMAGCFINSCVKTAYEAEKNISAEEKRKNELIYTLKYIIRTADFELLNRLEVRDNRTGKIWR